MDKLNESDIPALSGIQPSSLAAADDIESCLTEIAERSNLIRTLVDVSQEWVEAGEQGRANAALRAIWAMADGAIAYVERGIQISRENERK